MESLNFNNDLFDKSLTITDEYKSMKYKNKNIEKEDF